MPLSPSSLRNRTLSALKLAALAGVVSAPLLLQACGGGEAPPPAAPPAPSASAAPSAAPAASAAPPASASAAPPAETASAAPPPAPTTPASTKVTTKNDPAWAGCHQSYEAKNKEVVKDVAAMAKSCAAVTKMKEVGKPFKGKQ